LPPWWEHDPERPPEWLNKPSTHCSTYPFVVVQNDAMQLKELQKLLGGFDMTLPPQKL